tara:strand:+ start:290 stop:709 length:420 start_codon:yes stop_codon:yes gene_type:complete
MLLSHAPIESAFTVRLMTRNSKAMAPREIPISDPHDSENLLGLDRLLASSLQSPRNKNLAATAQTASLWLSGCGYCWGAAFGAACGAAWLVPQADAATVGACEHVGEEFDEGADQSAARRTAAKAHSRRQGQPEGNPST